MLRQAESVNTASAPRKDRYHLLGCRPTLHVARLRLLNNTNLRNECAASATESSLVPETRSSEQHAVNVGRSNLHQTQADSAAHAAALSRVLGLAQPRLMSMVERCPALFSFSPEALGATVGALAELTGLQVFQIPPLLWVDPGLMLQPDRLKANMRGTAQALGVPLSEVVNMGAREPTVLALSGREAEERLRALSRLLLPQEDEEAGRLGDLVAAVLRNPGALLIPEPAAVEAQLQALEAALNAVVGGEEEEEQQEKQDGAGAQPLRPPGCVAADWGACSGQALPAVHTAAAAGGQGGASGDEGGGDPSRGGCPGGKSEAALILVSAPELLGVNVGSLSAKWMLLVAVLRAGGEGWERRLAGAAAPQRAQLLALPHARLVRLRFLVDSGLQAGVDPLEALQLPDALFHSRYPQFKSWKAT